MSNDNQVSFRPTCCSHKWSNHFSSNSDISLIFSRYWIQLALSLSLSVPFFYAICSGSRAAKLSLYVLFFSWWYSPPFVRNSLVGCHGSLLRFVFTTFLFIINFQIQIQLIHIILRLIYIDSRNNLCLVNSNYLQVLAD